MTGTNTLAYCDKVKKFYNLVSRSPYENKTYTLSKKSATFKEIISFIKKFSVPLVGQRTKKNDFKYTERPLINVYYDVNYDHQVSAYFFFFVTDGWEK